MRALFIGLLALLLLAGPLVDAVSASDGYWRMPHDGGSGGSGSGDGGSGSSSGGGGGGGWASAAIGGGDGMIHFLFVSVPLEQLMEDMAG